MRDDIQSLVEERQALSLKKDKKKIDTIVIPKTKEINTIFQAYGIKNMTQFSAIQTRIGEILSVIHSLSESSEWTTTTTSSRKKNHSRNVSKLRKLLTSIEVEAERLKSYNREECYRLLQFDPQTEDKSEQLLKNSISSFNQKLIREREKGTLAEQHERVWIKFMETERGRYQYGDDIVHIRDRKRCNAWYVQYSTILNEERKVWLAHKEQGKNYITIKSPPLYNRISYIMPGVISVKGENKLWGLLDYNGKPITPFIYKAVIPWKRGTQQTIASINTEYGKYLRLKERNYTLNNHWSRNFVIDPFDKENPWKIVGKNPLNNEPKAVIEKIREFDLKLFRGEITSETPLQDVYLSKNTLRKLQLLNIETIGQIQDCWESWLLMAKEALWEREIEELKRLFYDAKIAWKKEA